MKKAVFFAATAAVSFVFAADHGPANGAFDPVVLENDHLRVTVDRATGGTARSVIDKADGRELTCEYLTDLGWNGAFGRDRCVQEGGYPSVLQFLHYAGEKTVSPDGVQTLALSVTTNDARLGRWTFRKTYALEPSAKRLRVGFSATNENGDERWFTPWSPNIVSSGFRDTFYVAKEGVVRAVPGHDFFHYPERDWLAAADPKSGKVITFCADWKTLVSQYWCHWNGCHSIEAVHAPRCLGTGESYAVEQWIGVTVVPGVPASVTPDGVLSWSVEEGRLAVRFSPARFGALTLQPFVNGKRFGSPIAIEARADTPVRLELSTDGMPPTGTFALEVSGSTRRLEFAYDIGKSAETVRTSPWKRTEVAFGKVGSTDVPARKVLDGVFETSPLRKVFRNDRLVEGRAVLDHRAVRGGRHSWQFTVANTNRRENAVWRVRPGFLTDGRGGFIPFEVGEVGWITIDLPSMFRHDLLVGDYPDPIVPMRNDRLTVRAGELQSFFVSCDIPYDAPPGRYSGVLRLRIAGEEKTVPLAMEVSSVTLPRRSFLRSTAGCWTPRQQVLKAVGYTGTPAEFHEAAKIKYFGNRITPREADIPWTASEEKLSVALQDAADAGMTSFSIPSFILRKPEGPVLAKCVRALREKGLMPRAFYYLIDEPSQDKYPAMIAEVRNLRRLYPDLRILGTCYDRDVEPLFGTIDIWCRNIRPDPWRKARVAKGDEFMTSNLACMRIEDPLVGLVRQFCVMKASDVSGFLYWNMVCGYGDSNPWERVAVSGENGGAHALYPHTTGPIETIRWKALGYGIELFDLISMLDVRAASGDAASASARDAVYRRIRDEGGDLRDEAQIASLRAQLMDALERGAK